MAGLGLTAEAFNQAVLANGLRFSVSGATRLRAVTHLDVSKSQIEEAVEIVRTAANRKPQI